MRGQAVEGMQAGTLLSPLHASASLLRQCCGPHCSSLRLDSGRIAHNGIVLHGMPLHPPTRLKPQHQLNLTLAVGLCRMCLNPNVSVELLLPLLSAFHFAATAHAIHDQHRLPLHVLSPSLSVFDSSVDQNGMAGGPESQF